MTFARTIRITQVCFLTPLILLTTTITTVDGHRPKELTETCNLKYEYSCPLTFTCTKTATPGVGQCVCYSYYGFKQAAPKITDGINDHIKCKKDWSIAGFFIFFCLIKDFFYTKLVITIYHKFWYLLKTKQYTIMSANGRLFFYQIVCIVASHLLFFIFLINFIGIDPGQYLNDVIRPYLFPFMHVAGIAIPLELPAAWLDIVIKSVTMKKNSAKALVYVQYFLRFASAGGIVFNFYLYLTGQTLRAVLLAAQVYGCFIPFMFITGVMIKRILCPTMDKNHTNYKSAMAIKHFYTKHPISLAMTLILMISYVLTNAAFATLGMVSMFTTVTFHANSIFQEAYRAEYIMYGYRKALKDYDANGGQSATFQQFANRTSIHSVVESNVDAVKLGVGRKSILETLPKLEEGKEGA